MRARLRAGEGSGEREPVRMGMGRAARGGSKDLFTCGAGVIIVDSTMMPLCLKLGICEKGKTFNRL